MRLAAAAAMQERLLLSTSQLLLLLLHISQLALLATGLCWSSVQACLQQQQHLSQQPHSAHQGSRKHLLLLQRM
jgi:hypothetical protein